MTTLLTAPATERPLLIAPTANGPADSAALAFRWQPGRSAAETRLQISADRQFGAPVCDVAVGTADSLVLHGAVPADGRRYFWRVGTPGAWSAPAAFTAVTDEAVHAWEQARADAALRSARDLLRAESAGPATAAVAPPCHTGQTSAREAMLFAYVLVLTALVILLLMYWAV